MRLCTKSGLMMALLFMSSNLISAQDAKNCKKECKKECKKDCSCKKPAVKHTGSPSFIFGDQTPWENLGGGVSRQILGYDGQLMMVKVKFEKGAVGAVHTHYQSQCTYVASGKFEFTIDGVTKVVSAGDCLFKTPDLVHGCVCLEPGVLIDTFSPMRADFLKDKK